MIVVDTNIIAFLYLPTSFTAQAEQLLEQDPAWAAPLLWRSEFRNVLALYLRKNLIDFDRALQIQTEAESLLHDHEYEIPSMDVLRLVAASQCSAYDCEFAALARHLNTKLLTQDTGLLQSFPDTAMSLEQFLA